MSRLSKAIFLILIGLNIIVINQSCNRDQSDVQEISIEDKCSLAKSHISVCLLETPNYIVYVPDWDEYCHNETPEKILEMNCEEIKEYYFDD